MAGIGRAILIAALGVAGISAPNVLRPRGQRLMAPHLPRGREAGGEQSQQSPPNPDAEAEMEAHAALPPALLATPAYYGTLAAVRTLGRDNIRVTTAGPSVWAVSGWSKYSSTHAECPPTTRTDEFIGWLLEFGRQNERHVLLPTCDDTAWLYALYRDQLSRYFHMSAVGISAVHALLHKGHLAEHARKVGLDVPRSWLPADANDLLRIASELTFPVLLKPVTQVLFASRNKGLRVERPQDLAAGFAEFRTMRHGRELMAYDPSAAMPMVQEFFPSAATSIYNISSYAQGGKLWGARAGRKILQRPRRLGVGVCFEEAAVEPDLAEKLEGLVQSVGYSGVFEAEFIQTEDRRILIDFNPRFYNQMGFDVARGLQLPTLAYFGALQQDVAPPEAYRTTSGQAPTGKVFAYGSAFKVMIASQRLSGALSAEEADAWVAWYEAHQGKLVDAVSDPDDRWPGRIDTLQMVGSHLRHPRAFLRYVALNR